MDRSSLIEEVRAYCKAARIEPTTLGVKLFNNSRALERLAHRERRDREMAEKLRAYMAANPPPAQAEREDAA